MITQESMSKALSVAVFSLLLILGGLSTFTSPASAQLGDPVAGKKATEFGCRNCHDVSGNEKPQNPPGGAPSFFEIAQKSETTGQSLHKFLTLPHGKMVNVLLSGREIDDVTAYIVGLKRK